VVRLAKRHLQILGLVAVVAAAPRSAEGCSVCVTALADNFVPPIAVWSLFCVIWFLTTASIASRTTRTLRFVPSIGRALLATLVAVLLGAALLGPIPLILLGVPPLVVSVRALRRPSPAEWEGPTVRRLRVNAIAGFAVLFGLVAFVVFDHSTRTTAEYVLKWQSAGPAHAMVRDLAESGPESLPQLRVVVQEAGPWMSSEAAEGLAAFGDPAVDVPLLIRARHDDVTMSVRDGVWRGDFGSGCRVGGGGIDLLWT
jgi:hypothetical protein